MQFRGGARGGQVIWFGFCYKLINFSEIWISSVQSTCCQLNSCCSYIVSEQNLFLRPVIHEATP
uniref:Uncharacterized protein n=1 Tax=Manihot esculenta TaxID=3983 RepID=A0A2C9W483_MANES